MVREEDVGTETQSAKRQKTDETTNNATDTEVKDDVDDACVILEEPTETIEQMEETEPPKKILDPYQANLDHEESEVKRRSEAKDRQFFANACEGIQDIMKEIANLKNEKDQEKTDDESPESQPIEEKKVQVLMLILTLRRLSRVQKIRVRDSRDQTAESRQSVDSVTLQLQNLLYEVAHLKKEIKRCLDFNSGDRDISLNSLESFYKEAPESISRPTVTVEDPHQQHLARLHWELEQRRGQTKLFEKLSAEKNTISATIADQERRLASLAPRINAVLEATTPLQEALGLDLDSKREIQKTAQLLPIPLYTLWIQATAYAEVCDSLVKAEIKGNIEAAKKIAIPDDSSELSDSDEQELLEDSGSRTPRLKKHLPVGEEGKKKVLALHPLKVCITIQDKKGNKVIVTFMYALTLRFVTTTCNIELVEKLKLHIEGVLTKESFLECLLTDDYGRVSPNPAAIYYLQEAKVDLKDHLLQLGRPFRWAQTLCGLSFLRSEPSAARGSSMIDEDSKDNSSDASMTQPPKSNETISSELSAEHMYTIVESVKTRLSSRLVLHAQHANLLNAMSTSGINIPAELLKSNFPAKINSNFTSWRPINWTEYCSQVATELLRESGSVTCHHVIYKAIIERKHARVEALVAISPDHPKIVPVTSLNLYWQGSHNNASNNPHVRQMESEVNVNWAELLNKEKDIVHILPLILYRLAMCLDIYTEAYSAHHDQQGSDAIFRKEKIFFRPSRGPDRAFPFKYVQKLGVFAQR